MDHPDHPTRCPRCGTDLAADTPEGLCPACLLAVASVPRADLTGTASTALPPASACGPEPHESPRLAPGAGFGPYRIERLLGRGGMGEVYEAEHVEPGRRVALKVLSRRLMDPEDRARFLREGQLAASISHPNSVYIFGSEEIDGIPVIAMELLPGGTLKDRVRREGPLTPAAAVDAILQIIAGLDAAQAAGILHRDVKPGNCFVDSDGTVKIGDFGLSISTLARDVTQITTTRLFHGTPPFSSPEQLRGAPLDVRADIYAVGATLYYLLTGKPPFDERDLMPLITRVATEAPRSPRALNPSVPRGLAAIVLRCLAKDRAQRPPTYAALDDELRPFGSAAPTPATLGLRFLAGAIDGVVLGLPLVPIAMYWTFNPNSRTALLWMGLAGITTALAYYGPLEGYWGASIGKRICGLRVTGPDGQRLGLARALVRALILEVPRVATAAPGPLLGQHRMMQLTVQLGLMSWLLYAPPYILLGVLFSTARRRNGFAGLHDIVTRTRVIRRTTRDEARPTADTVVNRAPAAGRSQRRYGPFDVVGTLGATDAGELLVGFDPSLRRSVWIHALAPGTPAVPPLHRDLSRPGRLRWLSGGRTATEAWDAYEALDGAPFVAMLGHAQPWQSVRHWLVDLSREIDASLRDGSLPALTFERVWISRDGHAKLLDFKAPGVEPITPPETAPTFAAAQAFLGAFARSALDGSTTGSSPNAAGREPLPLSATALLTNLTAQAFAGPQELIARMTGLTGRAGRVEGWQRTTHLAMCAAPTVLMLFMAVTLPLMMDRMFTPDVLDLSASLAELSPIPLNGDAASEHKRQALEVYIAGRFGSLISEADVEPNPAGAAIVNVHRATIERIVAAHPHVSPAETARAGAEIAPLLESGRKQTREMLRLPIALTASTSFLIVALFGIVSAWVFRGGWLLRTLGIAVVTSRGHEASRLRTLWRGLVAWSPAVAVGWCFATIHIASLSDNLSSALSSAIREAPLSFACATLLGLLFVSGAAWAALHPQRGWQDRLAGTWLVPR